MASNYSTSNLSYSLSSEVHGHKGDIRAVYSFQEDVKETVDYVLTASRDKTACLWCRKQAESPDMILVKTMSNHNGFVSALCVIPPDETKNRNSALVVTAGQDKVILVHSMSSQESEPVARYVGHTASISSVIYQCDRLVSVSWDSTMRAWNTTDNCISVKAHEPAVWCVSGLYSFDGTDRVLTGGADKSIKLWEVQTSLCIQEYRGHRDVVRDVKVISSDSFLSAANDCTIRKWSIHSGLCLFEYHGHEAFVYSISLFPGHNVNDFVSSGEDGTIRVWRGENCVQTISVPAVSVWSVSVMDNGDIVSGSSDSVARVFTASDERRASQQHLENFNDQVETFKSSKNTNTIDVEKLPKLSSLSEPGKSTGDTKLINNNGRAEVYQWNATSMNWEKIGDAVGHAPDDSTSGKQYNGKDYDYVFDIEVEDGADVRKLKLPFNKGGDPYQAAERFIIDNDVPVWYLDKVAEFIMQNADIGSIGSGAVSDPFTGGNRYIPGNDTSSSVTSGQDPFTGGSRYVPQQQETQQEVQTSGRDPFTGSSAYTTSDSSPAPSKTNNNANPFYPINDYKIFTSPPNYFDKVIEKLKEFASTVLQCALTDQDFSTLQHLCSNLTAPATADIPLDTASLSLLRRCVLEWPSDNVFPMLDVLRLTMLNDSGSVYFTQDSVGLLAILQQRTCDLQPKNHLLVLRILSNITTHLPGQQWFANNIQQIVLILESLFNAGGSKNTQIALSTVLLNYIYYCSVNKCYQCIKECLQLSVKILASATQDNEAKARILLSIGTLCSFNKPLLAQSVNVDELVSLLAPLCDINDHPMIGNCSLHLMEHLLS